jgi:uncharacterized protein (TIGR00369 family)
MTLPPSAPSPVTDRYLESEVETFCQRMLEQPVQRSLGVTLASRGAGRAVCRMPVDPAKDGGGGYLHGGFVSMAVEVTAFFVAVSQARKGQWPATLDLHVALLRSAPIGATLEMRAELGSSTRSVAVIRVDVLELRPDGSEATVAIATVTKAYRDIARPAAAGS